MKSGRSEQADKSRRSRCADQHTSSGTRLCGHRLKRETHGREETKTKWLWAARTTPWRRQWKDQKRHGSIYRTLAWTEQHQDPHTSWTAASLVDVQTHTEGVLVRAPSNVHSDTHARRPLLLLCAPHDAEKGSTEGERDEPPQHTTGAANPAAHMRVSFGHVKKIETATTQPQGTIDSIGARCT